MGGIVIIGEAWGKEEARVKRPFFGPSGQELTRMLRDAGIKRRECYLTNVFNFQPENNDIEKLCITKKELPSDYPDLPPIVKGKYLDPKYLIELGRLQKEIRDQNPNVIIGMGGTALWACTHMTGITKRRGTIMPSIWGNKFIATYHPAYILRDWSVRPIAIADLIKARLESRFPEIKYPRRAITIEPDLDDLRAFRDKIFKTKICAGDIETSRGQITCMSLAPSKNECLVIPFWDKTKPDGNYWTEAEEIAAREIIAEVLESKDIVKIFQNGTYDAQYLIVEGFRVRRMDEDTMLMHHAIQPEMSKGLDFLASVYTNSPAWKHMRKAVSNKREE